MNRWKAFGLATVTACAALVTAKDARSDFESVYGRIPADQVEFLSSADHIKSVVANGVPTAIYEALEHGERVECLECIPAVEPLLYDGNAKTREIAAWWLRRRMLGVFGPGEVYERTINTLKGDADPARRANAAYALGEFFEAPGIAACAAAVKGDAEPAVRAAAASALGRLNDEGAGALGVALKDGDARVKIAAIGSAGRINTFTGVPALAGLTGDGDATVRRRAVELLDSFAAKDSVAAVLALAKSDPDVGVRIAACHALGSFHDASVTASLQGIAASDASTLVRDQASIALRRL